MKKGILILALLCVLALIPAWCLGETEITPIFQYKPRVTGVSGTNFLIVQASFTGAYGLYTTDGQEVFPCKFHTLESVGNRLFSAENGENGLNGHALVDAQGRVRTDYAYGAFRTLSKQWVLGYVLDDSKAAAQDSYDIKIGQNAYRAARTDLFYVDLAQPSDTPIASMDGFAFASVQVHGKYLSVADAEGKVTVYDRQFQAMPGTMDSVKTSIYDVQNLSLVDMAKGEPIAEGYTRAREALSADGLVLIVSRNNFDGTQVSGILDEDGNEILPLQYQISSVSGNYVVLTNGQKLIGLYSLAEGREAVPCLFEAVHTAKNTADPFVTNGYILVENGGVRGFYDVEKGLISYELKPEYYESMTRVGCVCYAPAEGGYLLMAADGTETLVNVDSFAATAGDGRLLIAKRGDLYGVLDWHGSEVLPFCHKTAPIISEDSKVLLRVSTGYEVDQIIR